MPVNLLPILVPLIIVWAAAAFVLFRWRRWEGWWFVGLAACLMATHVMYTRVRKDFDEEMRFRLVDIGDDSFLKLTTSRGDEIQAVCPASSELVSRIRGRANDTVQVSMEGIYDYGCLRAYTIRTIDGARPPSSGW